MTYRIGWLSPLTPTSGVGTFSHAVVRSFPKSYNGEPIDLTIFYVGHGSLYQNEHRSIQINDSGDFHHILTLFDLLIYNIGNNREHHEAIFNLLRLHPGIIVCHDYVYQHYLADRSLRSGKSFSSFAALLLKYGDDSAAEYLGRSRITSRMGRIRYSPWDSEASVSQPMSESVLALGSALIVHSAFAQRHAERRFKGPILRLGMPHDQKARTSLVDLDLWERSIAGKPFFNLVSFGHIQVTKCIDRVLAAIADSAILRKHIRYTVAGFVADYAYYDRLKAMVASMSLQNVVTFELDVSETRLNELMQHADMFSNLRRPNTEGSSVSLIEQLDTGKPVIVLDSGCYAEIPSDAAVKLPPDVTGDDIKRVLEALIEAPDAMPKIGREGRAYARSWTCASYADSVMRFVSEHRALLEDRAKTIAIRSKRFSDSPDTSPWARDLARARLSLIYLDRNILSVDPAILLGKTTDQLCEYTGNVILGMFGNIRLQRALSRFFVRLDKRAAYWACVRFAIIVDAVFGEDEAARERLYALKPCYDPEFWSVIEAFPSYQFIATITLVLLRRMPNPEEVSTVGLDDHDGFPKRLRLIEFLRSLQREAALERLGRWPEDACSPTLDHDLTPVATDFECDVGGDAFRDKADLSGFYAMEADHAWTRGTQGFIGLSLREAPVCVDVFVRHIDASPRKPCTISIDYSGHGRTIQVEDSMPRWLTIELPELSRMPTKIAWLKISTNVACVPSGSADKRVLGVCLLKLRVRISQQTEIEEEALSALQMPKGARLAVNAPAPLPRFGRRQAAWVDR